MNWSEFIKRSAQGWLYGIIGIFAKSRWRKDHDYEKGEINL